MRSATANGRKPIKMDGFHLSTDKCMSAYYNRNPIYKANTCYCSVKEPRKNKQTKPDVDVHKNAEQQNQSIPLVCVCLHSWEVQYM